MSETNSHGPAQVQLSPEMAAALGLTEEAAAIQADARSSLLQAIATEAQIVQRQSPGQASGALTELARAYDLVTSGPEIQARGYGGYVLLKPYPKGEMSPEFWAMVEQGSRK